jgi:hypothetical protein
VRIALAERRQNHQRSAKDGHGWMSLVRLSARGKDEAAAATAAGDSRYLLGHGGLDAVP